jgi:hypothetical protein
VIYLLFNVINTLNWNWYEFINLDIIYAKYLDYRTGSGQRLRKIKLFILDILSTKAIIDESEITEVQDNINLDIETLSQIDNQFNILETHHSALISS